MGMGLPGHVVTERVHLPSPGRLHSEAERPAGRITEEDAAWERRHVTANECELKGVGRDSDRVLAGKPPMHASFYSGPPLQLFWRVPITPPKPSDR